MKVELLQKCIVIMERAGAKLTNVVQITLRGRLIPCQLRASPTWVDNSDDPATVQYLFGTTRAKVWGQQFKSQEDWLAENEYISLNATNPPKKVIDLLPGEGFMD